MAISIIQTFTGGSVEVADLRPNDVIFFLYIGFEGAGLQAPIITRVSDSVVVGEVIYHERNQSFWHAETVGNNGAQASMVGNFVAGSHIVTFGPGAVGEKITYGAILRGVAVSTYDGVDRIGINDEDIPPEYWIGKAWTRGILDSGGQLPCTMPIVGFNGFIIYGIYWYGGSPTNEPPGSVIYNSSTLLIDPPADEHIRIYAPTLISADITFSCDLTDIAMPVVEGGYSSSALEVYALLLFSTVEEPPIPDPVVVETTGQSLIISNNKFIGGANECVSIRDTCCISISDNDFIGTTGVAASRTGIKCINANNIQVFDNTFVYYDGLVLDFDTVSSFVIHGNDMFQCALDSLYYVDFKGLCQDGTFSNNKCFNIDQAADFTVHISGGSRTIAVVNNDFRDSFVDDKVLDEGTNSVVTRNLPETPFVEQVQDIVGAMVVDSPTIDATYDDGAGTITLDLTAALADLSDVSGDVPADGQALVWSNANNAWEPATIASSNGPAVFAITNGNGVDTAYNIGHLLGTTDVLVQVFEVGGDHYQMYPAVRVIDIDSVQIEFTTAPALNSFRVVVTSASAYDGASIAWDDITGVPSTFPPTAHTHPYVLLTDYEDSDVLTKVKNVDGSLSGLDSDLLDGVHSSAFAVVGHTHGGGGVLQLEPLTNGDWDNPELIYFMGDVVMVWGG